MISATAPGKVVLWGEYAVLEGAPAAVVAVNRYARCTLHADAAATVDSLQHRGPPPRGLFAAATGAPASASPQPGFGYPRSAATATGRQTRPQTDAGIVAQDPLSTRWRFHAHGFDSPAAEYARLPGTLPTEPAAILPWCALQASQGANLTPSSVHMHTEAFYQSGLKLGLGGSAALCVALQAAFAVQGGGEPNYAAALAAHRHAQGGRGSGIDVAASFFGGCLRFQDGSPRPVPDALVNRCFVWAGAAAQTTAKIDRFAHYLQGGNTTALQALADCSEQLFANSTPEALHAYTDALKALDKAAGLGVYSAAHLALERLASAEGLVYKPCGAGGGDVGVAIAGTAERLPDFAAAAQKEGFTILNLETDQHGVHLDIR